MINKITLFLFVGLLISCSTSSLEFQDDNEVNDLTLNPHNEPVLDTINITKVAYQEGRVKAFTDITFFDDQFFLVFRDSDKHALGENGVIHIFNSHDGEEWNFMKEISMEGIDLRDPSFAINEDDLSLYIHGSKYENQIITEFSDYNFKYSTTEGWLEAEAVILDNLTNSNSSISGNEAWPWRITWHNGKAYTIGYNGSDIFDVYTSQNGLFFTKENAIENLGSLPTEARIRVNNNDEFFVLARRNFGSTVLGKSLDPEQGWNWFGEIPFENFRGPNFLITDTNKIIFAGGFHSWVYLGLYDLETNTYSNIIDIPSFGDGSYPGMVVKDNVLWLSYYTSFENEEGSSIYIAKINLNYFSI
jgi:hypothetical protein